MVVKKTLFLLIFLQASFLFAAERPCYFFQPPKGWKCADPRALSPSVEVGFFGKGSTPFHPSINLATEDTDASLKEYLQAVKKIHLSNRHNKYREIGKITTKAGPAHLIEITTKNQWGEVKMLQAILLKENVAYVLTGALHQKEFTQKYQSLISAFQSFTFTKDLFSAITDLEKKKSLQKIYEKMHKSSNKKKIWKTFQKKVLSENEELGQHWQYLILKDALSQLDN